MCVRALLPRRSTRQAVVKSVGSFPASPVVVLNLPALSTTSKSSFEKPQRKSLGNEAEAAALFSALKRLRPVPSQDGRRPTLAILSPYSGQVGILERLFKPQIDEAMGSLAGFASARDDGGFVFTSDSFQGSEADVILASLVRNNALVGSRALGFVRSPQRVNVLLSRARHKLVLATSLQFIADAVDGTDPDRLGNELSFLRAMVSEVRSMTKLGIEGLGPAASILEVDARGRFA